MAQCSVTDIKASALLYCTAYGLCACVHQQGCICDVLWEDFMAHCSVPDEKASATFKVCGRECVHMHAGNDDVPAKT